jgi:pimeloyl-ACP methyl ester carboxylesterase
MTMPDRVRNTMSEPQAWTIPTGGTDLSGEDRGDGRPVVLLHGLTATRRYVVMGSKNLERSGHHVVAYDARGHGTSAPAPDPDAYRYEDLVGDLLAVLDGRGLDRAVLAGASMGAHTAVAFALAHPERVAGLVLATPAFLPGEQPDLARWDRLSAGLRDGGVEGFMRAYDDPPVEGPWRDTILTVTRQRMERHQYPDAVADALRVVPRSAPFAGLDDLASITAPTVVVPSRDEADPGHPLAVGEAWAEAIPGARLEIEEEGKSPLAWQGGRFSKVIADLAETAFTTP